MLKWLEIFYSGSEVVWGLGDLDMTWVTREYDVFFSCFPNPSVGSSNIMKFLALPVAEQIL